MTLVGREKFLQLCVDIYQKKKMNEKKEKKRKERKMSTFQRHVQ